MEPKTSRQPRRHTVQGFLRVAVSVLLLCALSWSAGGAFIDAAQPTTPSASGRRRFGFLRRPAPASELEPVVLPQAAHSAPQGSKTWSLASAAARIGVVMATAVAALPSRRHRGGRERQYLQGLSTVVAVPAVLRNFFNSNLGFMIRLSILNFCKIYEAMLVLRITIMWFPNINPYRQPFYSMIQLTDPYLNLFRGWMPPIFGIDLSVILAFVVIRAVIDTLTVSPF